MNLSQILLEARKNKGVTEEEKESIILIINKLNEKNLVVDFKEIKTDNNKKIYNIIFYYWFINVTIKFNNSDGVYFYITHKGMDLGCFSIVRNISNLNFIDRLRDNFYNAAHRLDEELTRTRGKQ